MRSSSGLIAMVLMTMALASQAFQTIPRESAAALGLTRGRPFSRGIVFINGKYIEPPYVVERYGTGIRINKLQVTGQLIPWEDFLKTQSSDNLVGVETEAEKPKAAETPSEPAAEEKQPEVDASAEALADLFGDAPLPTKEDAPKQKEQKPVIEPKEAEAPPPKRTGPRLRGKFVKNAAAQALVKRINAQRTEIDALLRGGGFICFGDSYSRVMGDFRICDELISALPELQKNNTELEAFLRGVHQANLVYLNETLCVELFRNRIDYRALQERRALIRRDREFEKMLDKVADPIF